ncbi:TetR/AcrR family transcriptional regulator [Bifidobacterium sp. ESL0732]|uniref:TetR/AcrR family transcriptional regulator n=1 Tax=Bifidobacterium sp. ESL0732 TaxID=2983222 RepID=UPI0023FA1DB9|nr:TetR/AcrR family transcriptional regulator [Bifidobacterium sp. ESL0732]WEV64181.1 TetR/AcrR family transcriptional regulator [Bifidobacterium sp. ESL0732]
MKIMKRGPYAKGQRKREEIIATATRVFSQQGFNQSSMVGIAKACHISRTALLHYFPNKQSLLIAVLRERDKRQELLLNQQIDDGSTSLQILAKQLELTKFNIADPWQISLYTIIASEATESNHPAHRYFAHRYAHAREISRNTFSQLKRDGYLREDVNVEALAANLLALMDGLQIQWLYAPKSIDILAQLKAAIQPYLTVSLDSDEPSTGFPGDIRSAC